MTVIDGPPNPEHVQRLCRTFDEIAKRLDVKPFDSQAMYNPGDDPQRVMLMWPPHAKKDRN